MSELDQDLLSIVADANRGALEHDPTVVGSATAEATCELAQALRNLPQAMREVLQAPDWIWVLAASNEEYDASFHKAFHGCGVMIDRRKVRGVLAQLDVDGAVGLTVDILCEGGPVRVWWSGEKNLRAQNKMIEICRRVCRQLGLPPPPVVPLADDETGQDR